VQDQLFLMNPGFTNAGLGPFYCGDSVSVEGMLSFFPDLRRSVEVTYIDFPRPRQAIVDLIGADHQSVPVLVLSSEAEVPAELGVKTSGGRRFIDDERKIRHYLSLTHGLPISG